MKRFVALARVSTREQKQEGFSLDVQEDALSDHAERDGGQIVKLFRVAETAKRRDERRTFRQLVDYITTNAKILDGFLVYKLDRATRNLEDYVEIARLEKDCGVPFIVVSQPTDRTPSGDLTRDFQAVIASYYSKQLSKDVKEGQARRVKIGRFVAMAPFGYKNHRLDDGQSIVEVHPENSVIVQRIFDLYANHGHTLDSLREALFVEGLFFKPSKPKFTRSTLHLILKNRAYIGELQYNDEWLPGTHPPLIDLGTWKRVRKMLDQHVYRSHELTYAGELIECGHCGHPITGEAKTKQTKTGERIYVYYRCARYNADGHPKTRLTERNMDEQMVKLLNGLRIKDDEFREWFQKVLRARAMGDQQVTRDRIDALNAQLRRVREQLDRLIDLRVGDEIDQAAFSRKQAALKEQEVDFRLQIEASDKGRHEMAELAVKAFELSQSLAEKWLNADHAVKRQILEIVCLNFSLVGATLVPTWRNPFDLLAEGPSVQSSRGDWI